MTVGMEIKPVAVFHSPFGGKFGIPRQSGLVDDVMGEVHLCGEYARPGALRGLDGFDYVWLLWEFSANRKIDMKLSQILMDSFMNDAIQLSEDSLKSNKC